MVIASFWGPWMLGQDMGQLAMTYKNVPWFMMFTISPSVLGDVLTDNVLNQRHRMRLRFHTINRVCCPLSQLPGSSVTISFCVLDKI